MIGNQTFLGLAAREECQYLLPDLSRVDRVESVAGAVDDFCFGVISIKMMNPDSPLAQGDIAYDVGLDGAAVVIIDPSDFLVLCVMRV